MSIHSNSGGGGRHLQPENFAKEIYIRCNICPPHLQDQLVKDIAKKRIDEDKVSYRRKTGALHKLVGEQSASVHNRKQNLQQKMHMPGYIFTG